MICAIVIISRIADACSAISAPKSTATGFTASSAALIAPNSARRCAGSSGASAMPSRWRTALWICAAFSRTCVCASARPCDTSPASRDAQRQPGLVVRRRGDRLRNSGSSGSGEVSASSRRPTSACANVATRDGSGASGHSSQLLADRIQRLRDARGQRIRRGSAVIWACSRASCSRFISSRSRSVSHQPISVRPSVS